MIHGDLLWAELAGAGAAPRLFVAGSALVQVRSKPQPYAAPNYLVACPVTFESVCLP